MLDFMTKKQQWYSFLFFSSFPHKKNGAINFCEWFIIEKYENFDFPSPFLPQEYICCTELMAEKGSCKNSGSAIVLSPHVFHTTYYFNIGNISSTTIQEVQIFVDYFWSIAIKD